MDMSELLAPHQLGFGVRGGVEAAIHSARRFLDGLPAGEAMIKLDFSNAFNSVRQDRMLEAIRDLCPVIFSLVHSAYSSPSSLYWENEVLFSASKVTCWVPSYSVSPFTSFTSTSVLISGCLLR